MVAREPRWANVRRTRSTCSAPPQSGRHTAGSRSPADTLEIIRDLGVVRREELATGNHEDVHRRHNVQGIIAENLSDQTFSPISHDGPTKFLRGHDPEAAVRTGCWRHQHGHKATVSAHATIEDLLKLSAAPDPPAFVETRHRLCRRHELPAWRDRLKMKPSDACVL